MNNQDIEENKMQKKHKKRTKKIKAQLQEQTEFYFGDANLQKDRFMKQEISKHPEGYVAISTIASFNKMKQITDDLKLVVKAMKLSSLLEVSEDETMVRRKTPIPEPRNVDAETIYVEKLPSYADHDWLKGIFSKYGKVVYVSIPRFKHTGDIKGFAFVEFENAKEAQEAVEVFNKGGKYRQDSEPEGKSENGHSTDQLSEQPKIAKGRRKRSHSESELETQKHQERKRKRTISESSADSDNERHINSRQKYEGLKRKEGSKSKESQGGLSGEADGKEKKGRKSVKCEGGEQATIIADKEKSDVLYTVGRKRLRDHTISSEGGMEEKRPRISDCDSVEESCEDETAKGNKKQKKRKRKKKEKKETRLPHLRVISKFEWLELKEEYKNLQREAMNNLKKQLQSKPSVDINQHEIQEKRQSQGSDIDASRRKNWNKIPKEPEEQISEVKRLPYTPGVVMKFLCHNVDTTKKELKALFYSYGPVAYLDFTEGSSEGHVRFHTAGNCASVFEAMSSKKGVEVKLVKLTGEAEKAYWEKINADRIARYNSKREKKRGTEKVAKKADALQMKRQSHIRFEESGDEGES